MELEALHAEHHDALVRYLTRYSGDSDLAQDAAQEAFIRLVERPPRDPSGVRAWLFTVATNRVRDRMRASRRHDALLEEEDGGTLPDRSREDPESEYLRRERRRIVRAALDDLTEKERMVLLMREEGFRHREIAEAADTTTGSVGTMIARALEKLARALPAEVP